MGIHLHASPASALLKIEAAYDANCYRIDGALKGYGGCPMAKDDLVGNIPTETIISFLDSRSVETGVNAAELQRALKMAEEIFPNH